MARLIQKGKSFEQNKASQLTAKGDLTLRAGLKDKGDLTLLGSDLNAGGDINLLSLNDINIAPILEKKQTLSLKDYKKKGFLKNKKIYEKNQEVYLKHRGSILEALGDINTYSAGKSFISGSDLSSGGDIALNSGGDLNLAAVRNYSRISKDRKTRTTIGGLVRLGNSKV